MKKGRILIRKIDHKRVIEDFRKRKEKRKGDGRINNVSSVRMWLTIIRRTRRFELKKGRYRTRETVFEIRMTLEEGFVWR